MFKFRFKYFKVKQFVLQNQGRLVSIGKNTFNMNYCN